MIVNNKVIVLITYVQRNRLLAYINMLFLGQIYKIVKIHNRVGTYIIILSHINNNYYTYLFILNI